jgi:transposase
MASRRSEEFRHEAVRLALTSGLTRAQIAADLGVGLSTLNKWVQRHRHDDLMSCPHDDVEKENARLRKENRILKEEREILKKATVFFASQR